MRQQVSIREAEEGCLQNVFGLTRFCATEEVNLADSYRETGQEVAFVELEWCAVVTGSIGN